MDRKLAYTVHVEDEEHGRRVLLAGTVPPSWAAKMIGPHAYVADDQPGDDQDEDEDGDQGGAGTGGEVKRPGKSGPGSGRDEWAAYAQSRGLQVGDQMSRNDIMAAVDELDD
jgi:hypothetical protein